MSVKVRGFEERDLPTLLKLFNTAWKDMYEFMPLTDDEVRTRVQTGKSKVLVADEEGKIVGSATYSDGYWGEEIRWLAIEAAEGSQLVRDALITEVERMVHGESLFAMVDSGSPEIGEWTKRGYVIDGGLYQMIAKLDRVRPVPAVPEEIVLRSMNADEEKRVVEAVNEVFGWDRLKPDFVERGELESPPFDREWVHLAELEGEILSVVVAWPAVKFNRYFGAKRGYLGPAATIPEYRSKKLASALTVRAMNFLYGKGFDTVVLHTSERNLPSVKLLNSIGFEVGHDFKFLRKGIHGKS